MTLRVRIVAGVAAILVVCLAVAFVAVYRGTDSDLRSAVDRDLKADMDAFSHAVTNGADTRGAAQRYIGAQPFRATTRLLVARIGARPVITNQPELVTNRAGLRDVLGAPAGYSSRDAAGAGELRLLTRTPAPGVRLTIGEPLESLDRARNSLARTFLLAGALALAVALLAGVALSFGLTARLRRMARLAGRVDGGDLSPRMDSGGADDEVRRLAVAFDTMLDRLQAAFDRQAAFAADASHELRTPLTVIRGQLEVLARSATPTAEDVRHAERMVAAEVSRMSRMVDDLLLLAAPTVHPAPAALRPLLHDVVVAARPTADRRFELGEVCDLTLAIDADRVTQAVRNAVRNAVEHTADGGRIRVSASADPRWVTIAVDDDGPGIPPADRERVFDRFHRGDARARRSGGAGLGLAIVRAIAEAHDGRAWAEQSSLGGARICLSVPR